MYRNCSFRTKGQGFEYQYLKCKSWVIHHVLKAVYFFYDVLAKQFPYELLSLSNSMRSLVWKNMDFAFKHVWTIKPSLTISIKYTIPVATIYFSYATSLNVLCLEFKRSSSQTAQF